MAKAKKIVTTAASASRDPGEVLGEVTEELLGKLGITAGVEVTKDEDVYKITLETEESGLLIGYHGETLSSLQVILGQLVFKRLGTWIRVVVEVGDYRAKREEQLRAMAESYAQQAVSSGTPVYLPYLPPIERRIVHMALADNPQVVSESEGEGRQRRVVVKPRTQ